MRIRLTLVYAVVLVGTCAVLLALNYALLYRSLYTNIHDPSPAELAATCDQARFDPEADGKCASFGRVSIETDRLRASTLVDTAGTSAIALAGIAVVGLGVCWIVAGRMLRPLCTLTVATRRISQDRLHERIALTGPHDEIKELADTFDEMVTRLEASFASQRRFVADAAHELRTPLTIVRTGADVQLAKRHSTPEQWEAMARRALTATDRAGRTLDALLALARSDSGALAAETYDLAVAAGAAVSDADADAEQAGLTITTDLRSAPVQGDPALLDRLVSNLVDNAVRHNRPGGWIEVFSGENDGAAVVTVRNTGNPIAPADVQRLFEPFQKLAKDRGSTGLGLAIVQSIVRAHGGTVAAAPRATGGLAVTVTLPVSAERSTAGSPG
ncbi:MAG TPA: HAMP domain-containing sensor histidine kinase [Asanoa sp.]|nr:HAMP domain-containing sensor histidine kinase [Asanoa sp.]